MKIRLASSAALLAAAAGIAAAQPTIDGIYDPINEDVYYGDVIWTQTIGTQFGDNVAGAFIAGGPGGTVTLGDPQLVSTGFEFCIPKTALGGDAITQLFAIINNGDRNYPSNQMVHTGTLPDDMQNIGAITGWPSVPDYNSVDIPGSQFVSVGAVPTATVAVVVDGQLDGEYASVFTQTIYTQFGDNNDAAIDNDNGSEIDGVYMLQDASNYYVFVAGNLDGNSIDIWLETTGGIGTVPAAGSYANANPDYQNLMDNQAGVIFETGFAPDYWVSVSGADDQFPVFYADLAGSSLLYAGDALYADETVGGALTAGDLGAPAILATADLSNTAGVPGQPVGTVLPNEPDSPAAPDANWGYGSELNNMRVYLDDTNNVLYFFIAGNWEVNANPIDFFVDCQPGGQNVLRTDNVDISFNNLNNGLGGMTFDTGFEPDWWMTMKTRRTGNNNDPLENYFDCATLRTDGAIFDDFFGVLADWGAFSGGNLPETELIEFPGTYADPADGRPYLFTDGSPRLTTDASGLPAGGNIFAAMDNSNVGGVGPLGDPNVTDPATVNTGIEFCVDLDELGWDGVQDILVAGFINNESHTFASNQFIGGLPAGTNNLGDPELIDLSAIDGDQFINITNPADPCDAVDINGDGLLNLQDVLDYIAAFQGGLPAADINGDGLINLQDVLDFIALFQAC